MSVLWQQKTHGVLKRKEKMQRLLARLLLGVVVITAILAGIYLTLVASNVHTAHRLWAMEHEIANAMRDNQALMTEIARLSSIPVLQERSVALGYQPAESIDYLYLGEP
jgi:cell division protein FtsL